MSRRSSTCRCSPPRSGRLASDVLSALQGNFAAGSGGRPGRAHVAQSAREHLRDEGRPVPQPAAPPARPSLGRAGTRHRPDRPARRPALRRPALPSSSTRPRWSTSSSRSFKSRRSPSGGTRSRARASRGRRTRRSRAHRGPAGGRERLHRRGGARRRQLPVPAGAVQFDEQPAALRRGPEHGEHTELVLLELGFDWDDITKLKDNGVIT